MKTNFKTMMLALAALGLFSCSDKLNDDTTAQSQMGATDGFIAFQISNVGASTRAAGGRTDAEGNYNAEENGKNDNGNYDKGNEYTITDEQGANVAFFFDTTDDGNYVDMSQLQLMSGPSDGGDHAAEQIYSARLRRNESTSYLCVLILNADPEALDNLKDLPLKEFMQARDKKLGQHGEYFTMSNTVYIDDEDNKTLHGPETIKSNQICKTWEEAQKDENKVKVHVERVSAKFEVDFSSITPNQTFDDGSFLIIYEPKTGDKITGLPIRVTKNNGEEAAEEDKDADSYSKWAIRIKSWGVNAKETETYFTKNLFDSENKSTDYPKAKLKNGEFGLWGLIYDADHFGWNDKTRVRSYWAVDPHYENSTEDVYPRQYREAKDKKIENYENETRRALEYIPYTKIEAKLKDVQYAPENTFGAYSWFGTNGNAADYQFTGDGYRWTSTHILIAADLLLGEEVNAVIENPNSTIGDKYCFGGVYWTADQYDILINEMAKEMHYLYFNNTGTSLYTDEGITPLKDSEGKDYFTLTAAKIVGGDGRQMLELKEGKTLYQKVVTKKGETTEITYVGINKSNWEETDLAPAIYQSTAQHFSKGMMYYAIPIEHMVALDKANKKFNIGSYGVVRNHWYKVNVKSIANPGTPVDAPNEEIVPNDDPKEMAYIAFEIVVIPWHVIKQDVEF